MSAFFEALNQYQQRPVFKYNNQAGQVTTISYETLAQSCQDFSIALANAAGFAQSFPHRQLIFVLAGNYLSAMVTYLTCLQQNHVLMLLDENINSYQLETLIKAYQPNLIVSGEQITHCHNQDIVLDKNLALLLSTSGSTGSPKQVALSQANLQSNASSICAYLPIDSDHTTITTLPMNYSYGLSVINSHLQVGACVFLNQASIVDREFWQILETQKINSLAGVPYFWEMMLRLGITKKELPFLYYFTQAGGKLAPKRVQRLQQYAQKHHKSFYLMYGQTEATARMTYLAPERLAEKPESIGQAIPGGTLQLLDEQGDEIQTPHCQGQLVYAGDNVMQGYAEQQAQLAQFTPQAVLATGDLAYFDEQGDVFITGRMTRFIKIHGLRVSLDDVEKQLQEKQLEARAVGEDNALQVVITRTSLAAARISEAECVTLLAAFIRVHHATIRCVAVDTIFTTANGKTDYVAIAGLFAAVEQ